MLYGLDDEKENNDSFEDELYNSKINKKTIICGAIIVVCIIVIILTICISSKSKNKTEIQNESLIQNQIEKKVEKADNVNLAVYEGEHVQIEQHDVSELKNKFVPKANPNAQEEITNIYYSDEKVAYLTFDDGPSKNITPQVLDILKQENVPATFFVLGSRVELAPDLVKREYDEGHYIANHGYSHIYSQIYQSPDTVFQEYAQTENSIRNALGNQEYNTYLFRFPGGSSGGKYAEIKSQAKDLLHNYGVNHTNWNCLTGDAEGKTTHEELMATLQQTMEGDGSIIVLMHDASDKSYTAEVLPNVISYLREQGYTFKNFYEIFK